MSLCESLGAVNQQKALAGAFSSLISICSSSAPPWRISACAPHSRSPEDPPSGQTAPTQAWGQQEGHSA